MDVEVDLNSSWESIDVNEENFEAQAVGNNRNFKFLQGPNILRCDNDQAIPTLSSPGNLKMDFSLNQLNKMEGDDGSSEMKHEEIGLIGRNDLQMMSLKEIRELDEVQKE